MFTQVVCLNGHSLRDSRWAERVATRLEADDFHVQVTAANQVIVNIVHERPLNFTVANHIRRILDNASLSPSNLNYTCIIGAGTIERLHCWSFEDGNCTVSLAPYDNKTTQLRLMPYAAFGNFDRTLAAFEMLARKFMTMMKIVRRGNNAVTLIENHNYQGALAKIAEMQETAVYGMLDSRVVWEHAARRNTVPR